MNKIKWLEISKNSSFLRFTCLSDYLNELGFENQVFFWEVNDNLEVKLDKLNEDNLEDFNLFTLNEERSLQNLLDKAINLYDQIRISSPWGDKIIENLKVISSINRSIGSVDAILKKEDYWFSKCFLSEAFSILFTYKHLQLQNNNNAFIFGCGSSAKAALFFLNKLGFKEIYLTDIDEKKANNFIEKFKKVYFSINFKYISPGNLIALPGLSSLVINCTPYSLDNNILKDIHFLNFLQKNGIVIDLTLNPIETPLIKEVKKTESLAISGYELSACVDYLWAKEVFPNVEFDLNKYSNKLNSIFQ